MLGQHLAALVDVGRGAGDLAAQAATSVAQVDVESLRVVNGVIDVDAIEVLERPFADTNAAAAADVGRARRRHARRGWWRRSAIALDELAAEVDELVGADRPRR